MTWQQGRETVQALLDQAELDRVPPSQALADRYLTEAARHLAAAEAIAPLDPAGAYQLAYDCARKAAASLLATQGLRATTAADTSPCETPSTPNSQCQHSAPSADSDDDEPKPNTPTSTPPPSQPTTPNTASPKPATPRGHPHHPRQHRPPTLHLTHPTPKPHAHGGLTRSEHL